MLSREEVIWLYRCFLGRDPENEAAITAATEGHESFLDGRRALILSEEFRSSDVFRLAEEKRGGIFGVTIQPRYLPTSLAAHQREIAQAAFGHTRSVAAYVHERSIYTFGELDSMIRHFKDKLVIQTALVIGGDRELDLALRICGQCSAGVSTIIKASAQTGGPDDAWALCCRDGFTLPNSVSIIERKMPPDDVIMTLEARVLRPQLVILDRVPTASDALGRIFRVMTLTGLIMVRDPDEQAFADFALTWKVSVVRYKGYTLLQKGIWFTPVSYIPAATAHASVKTGRLGVALIVKNEGANVEQCLRSVLPIADFVCLIDTGSTDDTVDKAKIVLSESGVDYIVSSIDFTNFASARNTALDQVPLRYDWCLMIDADEHLVPEDYSALLGLLDRDCDAWMLPRYNFLDLRKIEEPSTYPDRQGRLFRNREKDPIRYSGAVHETLDNVKRWGIAPANTSYFDGETGGPHIHHIGPAQLTKERWAQKHEAYMSLIGATS